MAKKKKKSDPTLPALPALDLSPEGRRQLHEMYVALRRHFSKKKGAKPPKKTR